MNKYQFLQRKFKNYAFNLIKNQDLKTSRCLHTAFNTKEEINSVDCVNNEKLQSLVDKYNKTIIYNCIIEKQKVKLGYHRNKAFEAKHANQIKEELMKKNSIKPIPVSLKYLNTHNELNNSVEEQNNTKQTETITHFPFESTDKVIFNNNNKHETNDEFDSIENEISFRKTELSENLNWMTDYENYDDSEIDSNSWMRNYGTPDPSSSVSNIPCGGCGALLHCKDSAIPGYIPSEIFKSHKTSGGQHLRSIICQRCHFLKNYNTALQVRVSPEDYPKILEKIKENKKALVILMVDLLDFPCSIWPNILEIIGKRKPIVVVGNKVDLLPQDSRGYLERIKKILSDTIHNSNLKSANIKHVSLISAKTGYGVENLITTLHSIWRYDGDVYLVGCTNVGKSTLFNVLLQSDYCKIKAVDIVQRATTSLWPGTTLNLLKFPILRPSGWRLYVRNKRLQSLSKITSEENRLRKIQLRITRNPKYATLIGNIERTFSSEEPLDDVKDIFAIQGNANVSGKTKIGLNENDPDFKMSKWCYDTPGVVQPDQILHLLTTEELMLTLPKQLIRPRTFSIKPGFTIFLAGLGRLDYINGQKSIRFTVFASENLPVTICESSDADNLYKELVGSELFQVPIGNKDRMEKWPELLSGEEIKLTGIDWETSCADVILSSAGWISVSIGSEMQCILKAWTPERRGIYIRESILSKAVTLRGRKIRFSPAYTKSNYFLN